VFDAEQVPDRVAVTVLDFAKSAYDAEFSVFNEEYTDEEPVFDEGVVYADEPLFDSEPDSDHVAAFQFAGLEHDVVHVCAQEHAFTDVDTACLDFGCVDKLQPEDVLVTCSMIFPNRIHKVLNTYCSSHVDCEELFHEDSGSLVLTHVQRATTAPKLKIKSALCGGFASKHWDPGVARGLEFMALGKSRADLNWDLGVAGCLGFMALSGPRPDFLWDPGAQESLQSIECIRSGADFVSAYLEGFAKFHHAHPHELHVDKFESQVMGSRLSGRITVHQAYWNWFRFPDFVAVAEVWWNC
jgi:hypothetical protein